MINFYPKKKTLTTLIDRKTFKEYVENDKTILNTLPEKNITEVEIKEESPLELNLKQTHYE